MCRILLVGSSGSGKTTLAERIARQTGIAHTEIDALYHGPNWTVRESFLADVAALAETDSWVTEWQYRSARPILLDRATLMVWLDYPVLLRVSRNIRRTVSRRLNRIELWNGNYEGSLWGVFTDPNHIIRWGWRTRHKFDDLIETLQAQRPELEVIRLRSQAETDSWLANFSCKAEH